jgi:hypothetical protein
MEKDRQNQEEQQFGELQEVSGAEHETPLEQLRRFAEKNLNDIRTLDDVVADMGIVAKGIQAVVLASGEAQQSGNIPFMRKPVEGGAEIYVEADANTGFVHFDQYTMQGEGEEQQQQSNFMARIPLNEDIKVTDSPFNMFMFANDWRGGQAVSYYPALQPQNPDVLRGFTRVVQDGVKNIVEVTNPTTQPPKSG